MLYLKDLLEEVARDRVRSSESIKGLQVGAADVVWCSGDEDKKTGAVGAVRALGVLAAGIRSRH